MNGLEKCYEYFKCTKVECILYGKEGNIRCWETEGTLCSSEGIEIIMEEEGKMEACKNCSYYISQYEKER